MGKGIAEVLLFASIAVNAALLIFFAGIYRKIINALTEAEFKKVNDLLVMFSKRSPFMIIALNAPFLLAIPYYILYGFSNWWITAGLSLWLVSGTAAKFLKMPVYKATEADNNNNLSQLQKARKFINVANIWQAIFYSIATVLCMFGISY